MITERCFGACRLIAECVEQHETAAQDILAELATCTAPLEDGLKIRFGWSLLTLRAEVQGQAQALRICEPDFAGDAEKGLSPTLDTTIAVIAAQLQCLRRVCEKGIDAYFDQRIAVARGALDATNIFALRGEPGGIDSGWSIAPVPPPGGRIDMTGLETIPIHRLVVMRPGLLAILALPIGYLVTVSGSHVAEITAPDGRITA
jgi:hypothetical protein